ncbi:MAG TPA: TetR/AcrR family transcriptional regulator C-terminal domain-containing protein [Bryobacteraceae bacterium]|jgi:AcrR family transcriptional regulator|nr:TetR/AcrR family transcriptional regulator C-terminal domain-containing protein [Bryobacteraceae bacterium]
MKMDAERQKAVLDHATLLFAKEDLRDITLDKLSKASGVAAFDIIRQFHSSENILKAVLERELELMAAAAQAPELRMPGETLGDELHILAGVILDQYRRRIPFLGKLLSEAMKDPKVGALFYGTFIVQGRLLFTEFLRIRKQFGELRDDVDVEAAAAMFLASLTGILLMHELFGGKEVETLDDDRVLRQMCDTFLHGVVKK